MTLVRESTEISLGEGYASYEIDSEKPLKLKLTGTGHSDAFIRILNCPELTVTAEAGEGAQMTVLFWNGNTDKMHASEKYTVKRDAALKVAYAEVEQADTERNTDIELAETGASAVLSSAVLTGVRKEFNVRVASLAPHTDGRMQNYSVVLKGGRYVMHATGEIVKGAVRSESHQTSRALCFDEGMTSEILPILLIDENDVQASHATSLGRVDEDQLYYMQSRGLTPKQCTALISTGYLMPVTQVIDNPQLRDELKEELERKISELCSM